MGARLLIGTSGYSYRHWRDVFYPRGVPPSRWLEFYADRFDAVELNVTHYRLPQRETFEGWHRRTPDTFRFAVKGPRTITHYRRLLHAEEPLTALLDRASALGDKLAVVLWQLPPSMKADAERLDAFCDLLASRTTVRQTFEFREESWFAEPVYEVLRAHGYALCVAHSPRLAPRDVLTAPYTYLRFHGGERMYDSAYTAEEIAGWARRVRRRLRAGVDVHAFFNNDPHGYAVHDALALSAAVRGKNQRIGVTSRPGGGAS